MRRGITRFAVLVLCDIAVALLMTTVLERIWHNGWLTAVLASGPTLFGWSLGHLELAAALVLGLSVAGNYGDGDRRRDYGRLFLGSILAITLVFWSGVWSTAPIPVFVEYAFSVIAIWITTGVERLVIDHLISWTRGNPGNRALTIFVGPSEEVRQALSIPLFAADNDYHALGFVDSDDPPAPEALGHIGDFSSCLSAAGAEVVVACGYLTDAQFQDVVDSALAAGCQVLSVPRTGQLAGVQPTSFWRDGQALIQLTAPSLRGQQLFLKRLIDMIGATIGLLILSPLFAAIAGVIKMTSQGSIFFTQERVGRGGHRFKIIKFRTMINGAEALRNDLMSQSMYSDPRLFKVWRDPRTTRIGRWLRRWSLDELPQLINVLKGEMSLVGPRPPLPSEVELYERHHYARFDVRPGMTGPWQVGGRNDIRDFESVVSLETDYIRNWSLVRDVLVLLKTAPVVMARKGAH